ncbi:MAG: hypothetical protein R3F43_21440 [bacterium]
MSSLDWFILLGTLAFIVVWGVWKTRGVATAQEYLRGTDLRWPTIGLSIMATQASAITFLSVPGQAYEDGMRFVQFYFTAAHRDGHHLRRLRAHLLPPQRDDRLRLPGAALRHQGARAGRPALHGGPKPRRRHLHLRRRSSSARCWAGRHLMMLLMGSAVILYTVSGAFAPSARPRSSRWSSSWRVSSSRRWSSPTACPTT